jgi:hypothetical protein
VARAGGNRRVIDTFFGYSTFPEMSVALDLDESGLGVPFSMDEWRLVSMVWRGMPAGRLSLLIDGLVVAEREYDARFDDGRPMAVELAAGVRPENWVGEIKLNEDGTIVDARPDQCAVSDSNVEIRGMRLYQAPLRPFEFQDIIRERVTS